MDFDYSHSFGDIEFAINIRLHHTTTARNLSQLSIEFLMMGRLSTHHDAHRRLEHELKMKLFE